MTNETTDQTILAQIQRLVAEEHRLQSAPGTASQEQLGKINVELDQCWDLLRQRRAVREYGRDPDEAKPRSPDIVEKYLG